VVSPLAVIHTGPSSTTSQPLRRACNGKAVVMRSWRSGVPSTCRALLTLAVKAAVDMVVSLRWGENSGLVPGSSARPGRWSNARLLKH